MHRQRAGSASPLVDALRPPGSRAQADRPFLGICLGLQLLFDGSEENGGCEGLGLIPGSVVHFDTSKGLPVPHIGWNELIQKCARVWVGGVAGGWCSSVTHRAHESRLATGGAGRRPAMASVSGNGASPHHARRRPSALLSQLDERRVYFVHSYHATPTPAIADWLLATADYGGEFVAAVQRGNVCATQASEQPACAPSPTLCRVGSGGGGGGRVRDAPHALRALPHAARAPAVPPGEERRCRA